MKAGTKQKTDTTAPSAVFTTNLYTRATPGSRIPVVVVQDIENALMKADVDRDKLKDRHNRPDAVAKGLELNDASKVQRRSKMMLPAPQISEQELQQIAEGGEGVDMDADLAEGGTDATRRLLGDYPTPQRYVVLCFAMLCWDGLYCSVLHCVEALARRLACIT